MKIILCVLFISACGYGGFLLSKKYGRVERLYFDLNNFCCTFNANLGYEKVPIEKLLADNETLFEKDFIYLADVYIRGNANDENIDILSDEQKNKIKQFFGLIGRGDAVAQREAMSAYGDYFKNELRNAETDNKNKGKLNKKLGVLLGVFLSVLIL